ncbi:MAG TPA: TraR/DksA C4-type zinc finger protein [Thermoleophilaceae bacterium]|nr:TraR/DksA C4-type zinc finger protein [Thermoleophilaceae bacterium]
MSSHDRETIEARLDRRLEELRRAREGARPEDDRLRDELSSIDNHPGDQGTATHEQELTASTEVYLEEEERRIAEARHALQSGTYGTCLNCGREIPVERLEAVPEAVRCVDCQRHLEGRHRQIHGGRQA